MVLRDCSSHPFFTDALIVVFAKVVQDKTCIDYIWQVINVNIHCLSQSTKLCLHPAKSTLYYISGTAQFQTEVLLLWSVASIRILFH